MRKLIAGQDSDESESEKLNSFPIKLLRQLGVLCFGKLKTEANQTIVTWVGKLIGRELRLSL